MRRGLAYRWHILDARLWARPGIELQFEHASFVSTYSSLAILKTPDSTWKLSESAMLHEWKMLRLLLWLCSLTSIFSISNCLGK